MSMGRIISVLTVLITVAAGAQTERRLYRPSSIAMEARLAFTAEVEIESSREPNDLEKKQSVEDQIQHLHGSLAALPQGPSYSEIPNQAFPLSGHTFRITSTKRVSPGIYTVTYNFEGTVFTRTRAEKIPVILPLNPKKIYQQTLGGSRSINRCTHPYFNTEGDFWLFWNSNWAECKIRREHLVERVGSLTHVPPVTISYPEYERLADKDGKVLVTVFVSDEVYGRDIRRHLLALDYSANAWTLSRINEMYPRNVPRSHPTPFIEDFVKTHGKTEVTFRLFVGAMDIGTRDSYAFQHFFVSSLRNSSIVIAGSIPGGLHPLEDFEVEIERISFDKNRYQIFVLENHFFDAAENLLKRKMSPTDPRGTKNLDLYISGFTLADQGNTPKLVEEWESSLRKAFENGTRTSYQTINGNIDSYDMVRLAGHEDNPIR